MVSNKAHIFDVWRQLGEKRAKVLRNLKRNLIKNWQQAGLDAICVADYNNSKQSNLNTRLNKHLRAFIHSRTRGALNMWKEHYFEQTLGRIKDFTDKDFHSGENSDIRRRDIIEKRARILFKTTEG